MEQSPPAGTLTPARLDLPTGDPLVAELFPPLSTGAEWKLDRMHTVLAETGDPHRAYPVIHIGGTNGKGSVASTVSSVLREAGYSVGLYTSPHLCHFRERFRVDGEPVSDAELRSIATEIVEPIVGHGLTFFEAATALAFHAFARHRVDVAVVEVGLGGRLDATNVVEPIVTAITNVDLDHADYLGDTIERIAREKAGIVKPGVPVLTAETSPGVLAVLEAAADGAGVDLVRVEPPQPGELEIDEEHTAFVCTSGRWGDLAVSTPLVGRHQAANAALAVGILEALPAELSVEPEHVRRGIANVMWPGRTQVEHLGAVTWLFDVAHNPAGVASLTQVLDRLALPGPLVLLLGILGDKDWAHMLPALFERADHVVLTQAPSAPPERRWDPAEAAACVRGIGPEPETLPDFGHAIRRAEALAGGGTVVVTGSNHTVGDALHALGLDPT